MKKQHLATFALTFLLLFGGVRPAEATFVDPMQFLKEFGTDTIAWFLGGLMTGELTRSTADWVNSGFTSVSRSIDFDATTGEPYVTNIPGIGETTFVANPGEFFKNISVDSATTFFDQLSNAQSDPNQALNTLFPGFRDDLLREIAYDTQGMSGNFFDNFVSDIEEEELDAYLNDFSSGGWDMFLRTTQNCANNYSCARIAVLSEMDSRIGQATGEKQTELAQGGGFLTIRECVVFSDTEPGGCAEYRNITPGQLIGEQITKATTVEFERYSEMDEITEVLVTLLEQALNTLISQGLSSLADNFDSRNLPAQYSELEQTVEDEVQSVEDQAGELGGGSETEPVPTTGTTCATVSGGNLCSTSTDIDMTADFSGATERFSVVYSGTETYESDVTYDFGEYTNNVTVVTSSENGDDTGLLTNGDTVDIVVTVNDPSLIEDFNNFEGVVTIGDLDFTVRGIDRR